MTMTTWGDLADTDAGKAITFRFPWEQTPTAAVFVRRGYQGAWDDDGTEQWVHFIDYGGDIGEQATQFRVDEPVVVT